MTDGRRERGFPVGATVTAAELEARPYGALARLRAAEPVSWLPALDGWLVTGRPAALAVLRDAATFTVDDPRFTTARLIGPSMLSLDGPEHARQREPFARAFRPAETRARFTAYVEEAAARLVAGLRPRGRAELRADLAGPLAVSVVARALGLRDADPATVRSWYAAFVTAISDLTAGRTPTGDHEAAHAHLRTAVQATIPGPGQQSAALHDHAAGRPPATSLEPAAGEGLIAEAARSLGLDEVVANAAVLMFGGIDTTEGMIVNAAAALLADPAQLALVRDDPGLLDAAVEESLRLEPAAAVVDRYATGDVTLDGAEIAKGDLVRVSITAVNRDPATFPAPDRFDVRRPNAADHLAFARGPHFCFGAHLARLETRTALAALLEGLPGLALDPAHPAPPAEGLVFRKPPALHTTWTT